jgi:hypothetical protein
MRWTGIVLAALGSLGTAQEKKPPRVYLLAGQSNMQGHGHVRTLDRLGEDPLYGHILKLLKAPDGTRRKREDAFVSYERKPGEVKKGPLSVGFGVTDNHVGPELMFGTLMAEHHDAPVVLVKAAWGGRSLALNFRPPSAGEPPWETYPENQREKLKAVDVGKEYREMLRITKEALAEHGGVLAGFVWFQGWNDMINDAFTAEYASNLACLVRDLRRDLGVPDLPVAIAEMGIDGDAPGPKIAAFRKAQAEGARRAGERVRFVPTAQYWDSAAAELLKEGRKNRKWISKEFEDQWSKMGSDEAYHYLGSAKIYSLIGYGLAEAIKELESTSRGFTPTEEFLERRIHGWTVKVHRDVPEEAIRLLDTRLQDIVRLVPPGALEELRKVPIWFGGRDGGKGIAEYHPDRGWLEKNGYNPEKAKAVDLGRPEKFIHESRRQPFLVLHELAHAYHDRVLGFDHEGIRAAYDEAVRAGKYQSVLFWDGRKVKHYALTNPKEYFAEGTEAYFGTNDFYPFVRAELREYDPGLVQVLERVWRVR